MREDLQPSGVSRLLQTFSFIEETIPAEEEKGGEQFASFSTSYCRKNCKGLQSFRQTFTVACFVGDSAEARPASWRTERRVVLPIQLT
jgi:hypothetical protein